MIMNLNLLLFKTLFPTNWIAKIGHESFDFCINFIKRWICAMHTQTLNEYEINLQGVLIIIDQ